MSTYLELCQELRQEAGITGGDGTPASVSGQTGEMKRVVDWIARAYRDVQEAKRSWEFLRNDFSFNTVAGSNAYTLAGVSLAELQDWKEDSFRCYLAATGTSDEQDLTYVPWSLFRDKYVRAANRSVSSRPSHFTIKPDKSLMFWGNPDAVYTIDGEYWKRPQTFASGSASPIFPSQFHSILVWKGLMYYGAFEGATEAYAHGQREFGRLMSALELDQLPPIETACALA